MISFLTKIFVLFISLHVIASDTLELPSCDQIAHNSIMCTFPRFKTQCASECGGSSGGSPTSAPSKTQTNNGRRGSNKSGKHDEIRSTANVHRDEEHHTQTTRKPTTRKVIQSTSRRTTVRNSGENNENNSNEKSPTNKSTRNGNNRGSSNCNKIEPCVDLGTANAGFRQRCQDANIASTCLDKCRYDITFDELKKAMLSKQCPISGMRDYLKAGANQQDNRMCCEKTGVLEGKREFCYPFCNPSGQEWPGPKEALKYLPCSSQMGPIMKCHWAGLTP